MQVLILLLLTVAAVVQSATPATLVLLPHLQNKYGAACIDGTPPGYYISPGSGDGVNKWYIHHQGGGWCTSIADCYSRSLTALGSSKSYAADTDLGGGYFSTDPTENPLIYNWNKVRFQYCDGASFAGNNETITEYNGKELYFRGFRNLQAYLEDLSVNKNLLKGTDFIISGCSAGGLATYLHADWWKAHLPAGSTVKAVPDSGFFLDLNSPLPGGPHYSTDMKWVFHAQNTTAGVNQKCIAAHMPTKDTNLCFFAEHTSPFVSTPLFPLQSRFDSWQVDNILGSRDATNVNPFGADVTKRFTANVLSNPANGCFFDSCYHHCGAFDSIRIDGILSGQAIKDWYLQGKGVHQQIETYPCATCCKP